MDDATIERLSRYLDGDLEPDEAREVAAQVEGDPRLQTTLRKLEEMRTSLRGLASREEPPAELDRVIEPLVRNVPSPNAVGPWVRWLATAAVVVLGVTVMMEVNRRGVGPTVSQKRSTTAPGVAAEPTKIFALAPLPESSLPIEEQPVGAIDRLIASPIPEIVLEDSPALDVRGPLDTPPSSGEGAGRWRESSAARSATVFESTTVMDRDAGALKSFTPNTQKTEEFYLPPAPTDTIAVPDSMRSGKSADHDALDTYGQRMKAQLFIFDEGRAVWLDFKPTARCKKGRYAIRVRVESGRIAEVWPVGAATSPAPQERLCAAGLVTELDVSDVADGEYHAEVVIEARVPGES